MVTKSRNRIVIGCAAVVTSLLVQAIPASAHVTINTYGTTFTAGATTLVLLTAAAAVAEASSCSIRCRFNSFVLYS